MTYFPFPGLASGQRGTGEVGVTHFSVNLGTLPAWQARLAQHGVTQTAIQDVMGQRALAFAAPDGDRFLLIERDDDPRQGFHNASLEPELAIKGFAGASLRLADVGPTRELLTFMGYQHQETKDGRQRFYVPDGNGADHIDLEEVPGLDKAGSGAGSVHHIAFAVADRAAQDRIRQALIDEGQAVTKPIDRDYFWAIYFRTPGGILFEIATNEPGFDRDEDLSALGSQLKLPTQHAHLRPELEASLQPLDPV
jgi:glyoxalase family protein